MVQHVLPDVNIPAQVQTAATMAKFVREPDRGLETTYTALEECHRVFFRDYRAASVPDVTQILDSLKAAIFAGCHFVFSGLTPLRTRVEEYPPPPCLPRGSPS